MEEGRDCALGACPMRMHERVHALRIQKHKGAHAEVCMRTNAHMHATAHSIAYSCFPTN